MGFYVVKTGHGLTRRLIEAEDAFQAREKFLTLITAAGYQQGERQFTPQTGEISVYPASEAEIFAFGVIEQKPNLNQIAWEL